MTGAAALAAGTPATGLDVLAQVTSERLGLTVAALIALAVLAVLGGVLVVVLRRQAQARAQERQARDDAGPARPDGALWAAGGANGAGRPPEGDDDSAEDRTQVAPGSAPLADTGAEAEEAPVQEERPSPAAAEPSRPLDEALVVRPPLPREAWVAEIIWAAHATRFRVVARRSDDADAEPVAIAQTETLPWPPRDDASVQALTDASATLERVLLDSGWTGLPTGETWYSKRFAWAPQAAEPEPQVPRNTGRFDRRRRVADPAPVAQDAPR